MMIGIYRSVVVDSLVLQLLSLSRILTVDTMQWFIHWCHLGTSPVDTKFNHWLLVSEETSTSHSEQGDREAADFMTKNWWRYVDYPKVL